MRQRCLIPLPGRACASVAAAIVEAAAAVLAEHGDGASMSDVANAAGVARATLYRYFPNREALLEALGSAAVQEAGEGLAAARLDEVAIEEAFTRAVRAVVVVGDYFVVLASFPRALQGRTLLRTHNSSDRESRSGDRPVFQS